MHNFDNIEDELLQRFNNEELPAQDANWRVISDALHKKKNKGIFFKMHASKIAAGLALVVGATAFYWLGQRSNSTQANNYIDNNLPDQDIVTTNIPAKENVKNVEISQDKNAISNAENKELIANNREQEENKALVVPAAVEPKESNYDAPVREAIKRSSNIKNATASVNNTTTAVKNTKIATQVVNNKNSNIKNQNVALNNSTNKQNVTLPANSKTNPNVNSTNTVFNKPETITNDVIKKNQAIESIVSTKQNPPNSNVQSNSLPNKLNFENPKSNPKGKSGVMVNVYANGYTIDNSGVLGMGVGVSKKLNKVISVETDLGYAYGGGNNIRALSFADTKDASFGASSTILNSLGNGDIRDNSTNSTIQYVDFTPKVAVNVRKAKIAVGANVQQGLQRSNQLVYSASSYKKIANFDVGAIIQLSYPVTKNLSASIAYRNGLATGDNLKRDYTQLGISYKIKK